MILTIDIGNSQTVFGLFNDHGLQKTCKLPTDPDRQSGVISEWLDGELSSCISSTGSIQITVFSSVVPDANQEVAQAVRQLTGKAPVLVSYENAGMPFAIPNPGSVGSDRLINAFAARLQYPCPLIVLDLGTATTVSIVNKAGEFTGGIIAPGIQIQADSLGRGAAQLPSVNLSDLTRDPSELTQQIPVIGQDTAGCIRSGIVQGTAAMLDGLIERIERELKQPGSLVITGGHAPLVLPFMQNTPVHEPVLLHEGLHALARRFLQS